MIRIDYFCPVSTLSKAYGSHCRVICIVNCAAEIGRLDNWSVLFKKALMISQMIRINFVVAANYGEPFWSRRLAHSMTIDQDAYWRCSIVYFIQVIQNSLTFSLEGDALKKLVLACVND